jgi:hypothetical protein
MSQLDSPPLSLLLSLSLLWSLHSVAAQVEIVAKSDSASHFSFKR